MKSGNRQSDICHFAPQFPITDFKMTDFTMAAARRRQARNPPRDFQNSLIGCSMRRTGVHAGVAQQRSAKNKKLMVDESASRHLHPVRSSMLIIAVFAAHGLAGFLYYAGVWRIADSFEVNFGALYVLAGIAYFAALSWMPRVNRRCIVRIALAVVVAFLSSWAYMVAALNIYGS